MTMYTEQKVMSLLLRQRTPATIRAIAKSLPADYKITHTAVQRLHAKQAIAIQTIGNSSLCTINPAYYGLEIYEAEETRKQQALQNKTLYHVYQTIIRNMPTQLYILLLFGSYAKGTQKTHSDIDMIFIAPNKEFEDIILQRVSLIPKDIHALVFTEEEYKRMRDAAKSNVVQEALQHCIILYGIESFYEMNHA